MRSNDQTHHHSLGCRCQQYCQISADLEDEEDAAPSVPLWCDFGHNCRIHDRTHRHGFGCGHQVVSHDGHVDYLVDGHLHHVHTDHCDNHGNYKR